MLLQLSLCTSDSLRLPLLHRWYRLRKTWYRTDGTVHPAFSWSFLMKITLTPGLMTSSIRVGRLLSGNSPCISPFNVTGSRQFVEFLFVDIIYIVSSGWPAWCTNHSLPGKAVSAHNGCSIVVNPHFRQYWSGYGRARWRIPGLFAGIPWWVRWIPVPSPGTL